MVALNKLRIIIDPCVACGVKKKSKNKNKKHLKALNPPHTGGVAADCSAEVLEGRSSQWGWSWLPRALSGGGDTPVEVGSSPR